MAPETTGVLKLIVEPAQIAELLFATGAAGDGFTVIVTAFEVAVGELGQAAVVVITQVII